MYESREARELLEEAWGLLDVGKALVESDPVQACERLYEAAEFVMRAVARVLGMEAPHDRWSADMWLRVVRRARRELNVDLFDLWTAAQMLLIEGAYEGHLTPEDIEDLIEDLKEALLNVSLQKDVHQCPDDFGIADREAA